MVPASSPFIVTLDACVLFPASLRDTLLYAADAGLYRPAWTEQIWAEVTDNLKAKKDRPMTEEAASRLMADVRASFEAAFVTEYEGLIAAMTNHEKDRHVLAAAVVARAQVIVTFNMKDFPASALAPFDIEAQHPDEFLSRLFDLAPQTMADVIRTQAAALKRPPMTPARVLDTLARHTPRFVASVRPLIDQHSGA